MTAAERQRRRRKRLRKEKREAETEALRAKNRQRYLDSRAKAKAEGYPDWTIVPAAARLPNPADEIAAQIDDAIRSDPDVLTIEEILEAIHRRFGLGGPGPAAQ